MTNIESDKVYLYRVPIDAPTAPFSAYRELASEALSKLNLVLPEAGTVLLKPNATVLYEPDRRIITHPGFLAGIIDAVVEQGVDAGRVLVADGGTGENPESEFSWKNAGYTDFTASRGAQLKCFNEAPGRPVAVDGGQVYESLPIYEDVIDCAFLFNVPLAKCHNLGCTTLAMKNLMGVVVKPERHLCSIQEIDKPFEEAIWRLTATGLSHFEDRFYDKLCDLLTAVRSLKMPRLSIVDGMIGRDGTAFNEGDNHPLGWTVIGENEVHVDSVATYLMGLDPAMTPYLRAASGRGLGSNQMSEIDVVDLATGESMDAVALQQAQRREPLMPLAGYGERYYDRFDASGSAVPWRLEDVNEQLKKDGKPPIAVELRPC